MKEFTHHDGATLSSFQIRADGALLLPPRRGFPPAAPALRPSSTKCILEQGAAFPSAPSLGAKSPLPTACWTLPARLADGESPWDPGCGGGLCQARLHSAPPEAHRTSASIPPLPLPALRLRHGSPIPGEKPFHLVQKRLAAGFTLPGVPTSPGGAGSVVAWQLPKGSGRPERLSCPAQLFPEDFLPRVCI